MDYNLIFSQLKRRLIGGIWVLKDDEKSFQYCTESEHGALTSYDPVSKKFSGFHKTFLGIVKLEDYGSITPIGKMLGYSKLSPKVFNRKYFEFLDSDFFQGLFVGAFLTTCFFV